MAPKGLQVSRRDVLELAGTQHGVVARSQLIQLGLSSGAIKQRIRNGRLHPVLQGVYAVGRPQISRCGLWMAAVLRCGPDVALSHQSAGALWEIGDERLELIDISLPARAARRVPGIAVTAARIPAPAVSRPTAESRSRP
jgi:putative AbiEi antitoxin of type IV toxin-antitoxin system